MEGIRFLWIKNTVKLIAIFSTAECGQLCYTNRCCVVVVVVVVVVGVVNNFETCLDSQVIAMSEHLSAEWITGTSFWLQNSCLQNSAAYF